MRTNTIEIDDVVQINDVLERVEKLTPESPVLRVLAPANTNILTKLRAALDMRVRTGQLTAAQLQRVVLATNGEQVEVAAPVIQTESVAADPLSFLSDPVVQAGTEQAAMFQAEAEIEKATNQETDPPIDPPVDDDDDESDEGD